MWYSVTVEITSASISDLLNIIRKYGYQLRNVRYLDPLRMQVDISESDSTQIQTIIKKRGDSFKIIGKQGVYYAFKQVLHRPVLLIGCVLWLFLVLYLPTRVLFIYVDGNSTVSTAQILEAAERSGICFGASRSYVRSEKVKNKLMSEISSLQWAGVNTFGCVAVISVKERMMPQNDMQDPIVSSIVASRDGIISSATATRGNLLCKTGQAVRRGQILVSGFTDCGLLIRAEQSEGEIMAFTNRSVSASALETYTKRLSVNMTKTEYSVQIGKNIIKLFNKSSIPDGKYVKMYSQKYLTLPGGFELPVSLITERICIYNELPSSESDTDAFTWMKYSAESYLTKDMVAGRIIRANAVLRSHNGLCRLKGSYLCNEMIGQIHIEKMGEYNG